jgi:hypothetical protein
VKKGVKIIVDFFLLSLNSELSYFGQEPQFKSLMAFTNLEKTDIIMVLIYSEACGHSGPWHGKYTSKGFLKGYFPMHEPL